MAKQRQAWERAYDKICVVKEPAWITMPSATDAEVDEVETQLGSQLPYSYREFMKRFGAGEFSGFIRTYPVASRARKPQETVASRTATLRALYAKLSKRNANYQLAARLVYFGDNDGGDEFGWNPDEMTQAKPHECRIYCVAHGAEDQPVVAGESFGAFVALAVSNYLANTVGRREAGSGVPFSPQFLRSKKNPSPRDVQAWLTCNNGIVRDLAQSVRKSKKNTWPVLADALEDAGCTHADLLHSCRNGDPEIDGVWVLQVLLGQG